MKRKSEAEVYDPTEIQKIRKLLKAYNDIIIALQPLPDDGKERVIKATAIILGINV